MKAAVLVLALVLPQAAGKLEVKPVEAGGIAIHRAGQERPLLVHNARPDTRPWLHPIAAPDGKGILTEESPGHHKHQTGIYVGFLKVNGRDYFHQRGAENFRRKAVEEAKVEGNRVAWAAVYELLDGKGGVVLEERQAWAFTDEGDRYRIDLEWTGRAAADLKVEKHDYGGLFVRMPWRKDGEAVNSEGKKNGAAEGQRSKWVDIGMPIEGRSDWGHIAVLDHPKNPGHPIPWRVDGQLGVGPARSRLGDWSIPRGEAVTMRYRLLVYAGAPAADRVESEWKKFGE